MDQTHAADCSARRRALLVATLLTITVAIGGYLRLRDLGAPSLWFDEGITLEQATRPDLQESIESSTTHPPLARLLVRASVALLGRLEPAGLDYAARLPSALLGTLGIVFFFLCARRLAGGDDLVGLLAAMMYAVFPFGVYYGQEARYYAGLALFAAWAYHGAMLVAERPHAAWRQIYLFLGLLLGLYNHHLGVVAFLAAGLFLLPALRAAPRSAWVPLLPHAASAAAFAPWLHFAFTNLEDQARPWIPNLAFQLPDVLAGWFTGRVGFYHLLSTSPTQFLGLSVASSAGLLVVAGLIVHLFLRRRIVSLMTALALLGPLLGAAFLHEWSASTRFFHHKYLAFVYPLVALSLGELVAFAGRSLAGLTLWRALAVTLGRQGPRPELWHRDLLLFAGMVLLLGFLFVTGRPVLRGALEAHERQRWGSATYLPREHYQEVARWIQVRRRPRAAVAIYDPHRRLNNVWLLRYYGVKGPLLPISDWLTRNPDTMRPAMRRTLDEAREVFVVTAHASPEEQRRMLALIRDDSLSIRAVWSMEGAEGITHAVHLSKAEVGGPAASRP